MACDLCRWNGLGFFFFVRVCTSVAAIEMNERAVALYAATGRVVACVFVCVLLVYRVISAASVGDVLRFQHFPWSCRLQIVIAVAKSISRRCVFCWSEHIEIHLVNTLFSRYFPLARFSLPVRWNSLFGLILVWIGICRPIIHRYCSCKSQKPELFSLLACKLASNCVCACCHRIVSFIDRNAIGGWHKHSPFFSFAIHLECRSESSSVYYYFPRCEFGLLPLRRDLIFSLVNLSTTIWVCASTVNTKTNSFQIFNIVNPFVLVYYLFVSLVCLSRQQT